MDGRSMTCVDLVIFAQMLRATPRGQLLLEGLFLSGIMNSITVVSLRSTNLAHDTIEKAYSISVDILAFSFAGSVDSTDSTVFHTAVQVQILDLPHTPERLARYPSRNPGD